jgi:tetratricopeptide (TPR) repeat protein
VVLGRVLADQDRGDEADAEFRRVLELDPHNLVAIRSLADLARARGDRDQALDYYNRLLESEPTDEEARAIVEELTGGAPLEAEAGTTPEAGPDDVSLPAEAEAEAPWAAEPEEPWSGESEEPWSAGTEEEPSTAEAEEPWASETDDPWGASAPTEPEAPESLDESREPDFDASADPWAAPPGEPEEEEVVDAGDADEGGDMPSPWATTTPELEPAETDWTSAGAVGEGELTSEGAEAYGAEETVDGEDEAAGEDEVRTETIAQVYARQGLYDRAAEVYRELIRVRPEDEHLRDRLAEMEQLAARSGAEEAAAVEDMGEEGSEPEWSTELENEAHEEEPEPYAVEGLQSTDFDPSEVDASTLAGLETDETDPETGLRADTWSPLGEETETSETAPVDEAPEEEPTPWAGAAAEAEEEPTDADSVWTGGDWGGDEPDMTPHAWTEDEAEEDTSSPIRSYFGGLLGWADAGGTASESPASESPADPYAPPPDAPAPDEPDEGVRDEGEEGTGASDASDDDDDLEMFRSWLESLKQ